MPRRRDDGLLEAALDAVATLPWWVGVTLAIAAYALLHRYAVANVPAPVRLEDAGHAFGKQMMKGLAGVWQYLVPAVFLLAAIASVRRRRKRSRLLRDVAGDESGRALRTMDWRDFELLVGEAFRKRGYWVTETGGGGADGGVDLKLEKGREVFLVQCKQWRAYRVSVNVVRELLGVMVAQGATGGFVVTSGVFTPEAQAFAKGRNIELLDGAALTAMVGEECIARGGAAPAAGETSQTLTETPPAGAPACPLCGRGMVRRTARRGANAGSAFWGCPAFPDCRGTRPMD